jgi:hypothetical protein
LLLSDLAKVLYAPHKAFKQIIQKPTYLGTIIVLILFVAAQTAFYYSYYDKVYSEQTYPAGDQFGTLTQNSTLWSTSSDTVISRNYDDLINSTLYGNSSLQFALSNSSSLFVELNNLGSSVNCGPSGFQNVSMRIKIVEPQTAPEQATLYMYSLSDANYFQYDLTQQLSTTGVWNNLTIPVGSGDWSSNGNPNWQNITGLKVDLAFSTNSSITLRMEGVFFRGVYKTPIEADNTVFLVTILQLVFTQFLFEWIILTGLIYILIKVMKGTVTWKPLAAAIGFALITLVIQTIVAVAATSTLTSIYYPIEFLASVPGEAQAVSNAVAADTETFSLIFAGFQIATYLWIVGLGALITRNITAPVGEETPETPQFSWMKCFLVSGVSMFLTIIILGFLVGV